MSLAEDQEYAIEQFLKWELDSEGLWAHLSDNAKQIVAYELRDAVSGSRELKKKAIAAVKRIQKPEWYPGEES